MKHLFTLLPAALFSTGAYAQFTIADSFSNRSKLIDNTLLTHWGTNTTAQTGFELIAKTDNNGLSFPAIRLVPSIVNTAVTGYTSATSLKTLTSIDYRFPSIVNRNTADIIIEFDAIWDALSSSGENGRLVVTLLDGYPASGAQFGQVDDLSLTNPFARPLYNLRIRNNNTGSANGPLLLYGAGTTPEPEWERYGAGPWWLPGFSIQAGGGSPGTGPDYPGSGTKRSTLSIASTTRWRHYKWVIKAERMELFYRNTSQPVSAEQMVFFMQIPKKLSNAYVVAAINDAHGSSATTPPPNYDWFGQANAVRFYWRGIQNTFLANVNIYTNPLAPLPITISTVKGERQANGKNKLRWTDLSTDVCCYNIEYSEDGAAYTTVGKIETEPGKTAYEYQHQGRFTEKNFYRIKSVSKNSHEYSYSNVVLIRNKPRALLYAGFDATSRTIAFNATGNDETYTFDLTNAAGQTAVRSRLAPRVRLAALPNGLYILSITKAGRLVETHKIVL